MHNTVLCFPSHERYELNAYERTSIIYPLLCINKVTETTQF